MEAARTDFVTLSHRAAVSHDAILRAARQALFHSGTDAESHDATLAFARALLAIHDRAPADLARMPPTRLDAALRAVLGEYGLSLEMSPYLQESIDLFLAFPSVENLLGAVDDVVGLKGARFSWLGHHFGHWLSEDQNRHAARVYLLGVALTRMVGDDAFCAKHVGDELIDPFLYSMEHKELSELSGILGLPQGQNDEREMALAVSGSLVKMGSTGPRAWCEGRREEEASCYFEILLAVAKAHDVDVRGVSDVEEIEDLIAAHSVTRAPPAALADAGGPGHGRLLRAVSYVAEWRKRAVQRIAAANDRVQGLLPNSRSMDPRVSNPWVLVLAAAIVSVLLTFLVMKYVPQSVSVPRSTGSSETSTRTVFAGLPSTENTKS